MNPWVPELPALACAAVAVAGIGQGFAGWMAARRLLARRDPASARPPITVMKPLHGAEALLEAALESFCRQDYPAFQLLCGVGRADDPAAAIVARLQARYPDRDIGLVVDARVHGPNRKIGNLINMLPSVKHDRLVFSDSDMHASPDYLARVADALAAPGTGLVTSLYVGLPARPTIANRLGAAFINQNFASGAALGWAMGREDCLGATMALTRETLQRAGGLGTLVRFVADDAILGQQVRALGLRVRLVPSVPATTVDEGGLWGLFRHEQRWARTIRAVEPVLFVTMFVQYPVFWALLALLLGGGSFLPFLAAIVALRSLAGRGMERALGAMPTPLWLCVLRDTMSVAVALSAYAGRQVVWRDATLSTEADSEHLHPHKPAGGPMERPLGT